MADGADIEWSRLRPAAGAVGSLVHAFETGRRVAGRPAAAVGVNAFGPAPPASEAEVMAKLDGLTGAARTRAAQQAELLAAIGAGLQGRPYAERRAILAHMAPALAARGVPPEATAAFDPTDANLRQAVATAQALGERLAPGRSGLTAAPAPVADSPTMDDSSG